MGVLIYRTVLVKILQYEPSKSPHYISDNFMSSCIIFHIGGNITICELHEQ